MKSNNLFNKTIYCAIGLTMLVSCSNRDLNKDALQVGSEIVKRDYFWNIKSKEDAKKDLFKFVEVLSPVDNWSYKNKLYKNLEHTLVDMIYSDSSVRASFQEFNDDENKSFVNPVWDSYGDKKQVELYLLFNKYYVDRK